MAIVHDFELDVRGEACPYPLIRTKQQVDWLQKGEVLKVVASDPVTRQNIDAWAKKSGNEQFLPEH
ncbi:MAG TPA: sulfurtransferase TusA family protein [Candidatus Methanoperedens sp.]